jgi:hypothetical protein
LLNAATWTDSVYNQYGHEDILGAAIGGTALVLSAGISGFAGLGRAAVGAKATLGAAGIKAGMMNAPYPSDPMAWLMGVD